MRFAYAEAGAGDTAIVLLHGWPQTSWAWRKLTPLLAVSHRVIAPDLPGFGDSSKPEGGYDKKTVSARVRALIQALGLSRIVLVGHDMGG